MKTIQLIFGAKCSGEKKFVITTGSSFLPKVLSKLCDSTRPNFLMLLANTALVNDLSSSWYFSSPKDVTIEDIAMFFGTKLDPVDSSKSLGLSHQRAKCNHIKYCCYSSEVFYRFSIWAVVFIHIFDIYVVLLTFSGACILHLHSTYDSENMYSHTLYIGIILILGAIITLVESCVQTIQSENALERTWRLLKKETKSPVCEVTRDGQQLRLTHEEIVPGDLIHLGEGDTVPHDVAVVWQEPGGACGLVVVPSYYSLDEWELSQGQETSMLLRGTRVVTGRCIAIVLPRDGVYSLFALKGWQRSHWLQRRLLSDSLWLLVLSALLATVLCVVAAALGRHILSREFLEGLIVMVVLGSVPLGLPSCLSSLESALIDGPSKALQSTSTGSAALVKHAGVSETLGACSVLCLDTAGTLGGMMVVESVCLLTSPAPPVRSEYTSLRPTPDSAISHCHNDVSKRKSDGLLPGRLLMQKLRRSAPTQQPIARAQMDTQVQDRIMPTAVVMQACASGSLSDHTRLLIDVCALAASTKDTGASGEEGRETEEALERFVDSAFGMMCKEPQPCDESLSTFSGENEGSSCRPDLELGAVYPLPPLEVVHHCETGTGAVLGSPYVENVMTDKVPLTDQVPRHKTGGFPLPAGYLASRYRRAHRLEFDMCFSSASRQCLHVSVHRMDHSLLERALPGVSGDVRASMQVPRGIYRSLRRKFLSSWPALSVAITGQSSGAPLMSETEDSVMVLTGCPEAVLALCSHHLHDIPPQSLHASSEGMWATAIGDTTFTERLQVQLGMMRSKGQSPVAVAVWVMPKTLEACLAVDPSYLNSLCYTVDSVLNPDAKQFSSATRLQMRGLCFAGLLGIAHSVLEHVPRMLRGCREAGVGLVLFSQESRGAAVTSLHRLGLLSPKTDSKHTIPTSCDQCKIAFSASEEESPVVISTHMLSLLSDEEWSSLLPSHKKVALSAEIGPVTVFADMSPPCPESELLKAKIIARLQRMGHVTGMVVGANSQPDNALAMGEADVGIAIGRKVNNILQTIAGIVLFDTIGDDGVGGGEGGGDCSHALAVVMQQGRCVTFSLRTCLAYSLSHSAPQFVAALLWLVVGVPQPMSLLMCVFLNVFLEVPPTAVFASLAPTVLSLTRSSPFRWERDARTPLLTWRVLGYAFCVIGGPMALLAFALFLRVFVAHGFSVAQVFSGDSRYFLSRESAESDGAEGEMIVAENSGHQFSSQEQTYLLAVAQTMWLLTVLCSQALHLLCLSSLSHSSLCERLFLSVSSLVGAVMGRAHSRLPTLCGAYRPFVVNFIFLVTVVITLVIMPVSGSMIGTAKPQTSYLAFAVVAATLYLIACTELRLWRFRAQDNTR